jgi:hypothetical protein
MGKLSGYAQDGDNVIDAIPRTRAAAKAAGLKKYTPFKICAKCGEAGEYHVTKGCLSCGRKRKQREHTARILRGPWLDAIADAITEARKSSPTWDQDRVRFIDSERLALVLAHFVTKPRQENKAPSPLTVADEVGAALQANDARQVGAALLGFAEVCGFIAPLRAVRTDDGARTLAVEVRLSIEADAQRAAIESRLAAEPIDDARPVLAVPPPVLVITPNHYGTEKTPPYPNPPDAVLAAMLPIQSTAWRVNPFMLTTLRAALAAGARLHVSKDKHVNGIAAVEQALYLSQHPQFFYRCEFDWRGRLYQLGGRLQYTSGADVARSLLEFAHGEPLTSDGRTWLAVHLATCHGHRGSYTDRAVWAHTHHDKILQSAADPLHTNFWRNASEPYQFLAACDAWRQVTENPHAVIHLPVAADATSSAFQHFALLLRDTTLAAKVNLSGQSFADAPAAFYGDIALQFDPKQITRDDVKKGAWFLYGQKAGTLAQSLADLEGRRFPPRGSVYWDMARDIRAALEQHAPAALELYGKLTAAAKQFSAAGLPIRWTLPDGFPVHQANRKTDTRNTEIWLHPGPWRLQAKEQHLTDEIDAGKQSRSLPANLIHSLDACLLRAIVREAASVPRWAVAHDSIGVHPNDGGTLRQAVRAAVEWMYGPDLLGAVLAEWAGYGVRVLSCHGTELPGAIAGGWYTFS